jgi:hypothetical protein
VARLSIGIALACVGAAPTAARAQDSTAAPAAAPSAPRNVLAWPLYVRWTTEDGAALRVYGPVTTTFRSEAVRSSYLAFPTTGVRRLADDRREVRLLWPLTDLYTDPATSTTRVRVVGPLLGYEQQKTEEASRLRIAPLLTRDRSASGRRVSELAPLYHFYDDPESERRIREFGFVPPLGGLGLSVFRSWSERDTEGWNAALLWGGYSSPRSRSLWLTPYVQFERVSGPNSPATFRSFAGLYSSWRSPVSEWWNVALLYGAGSSPAGTFALLPPYVSTVRPRAEGDTSRVRALLPVYGHTSSAQRAVTVALPSYWSYRSATLRSHGVWPVYSWYNRSQGDSVTRRGGSVAWPAITWGRGADYSALGLLPFFYRLEDGDTRLTLAPPLFGSYRSPTLDARVILPVYLRRWREADSLEIVGLYYRRQLAAREYRGLFPLYEQLRSPDANREHLFPVYYHARDARGERRVVFPLWTSWYTARTERLTRTYGPLVFTKGTQTSGFGVLPVYYREAGPHGTAALLGPIFWSNGRDGSRRVAAIPVGVYARDSAGLDLHLLPLTGHRSRVSGRSYTYILWPLYSHRTQGDDFKRLSVLLWLGRDETRGERRRVWLQPVFYYDRAGEASTYFALLGGLLSSYERVGSARTLKVLLIPLRRWG